jgi:hypothetical protein
MTTRRTAELIDLTYELLDAHADTQRLVHDIAADDLTTLAHLDYLRDLQRVGHEILARVAMPRVYAINHQITDQR